MPNTIKVIDVLRQLKADLIGKDSYRGVTLTYSWLANQFGHFSLGFYPTLILYHIFTYRFSIHNPALWSAVATSAIWLTFETYNFLGPLLSKKRSKSKILFVSSRDRYIFQPAWGNVAFDTITDLGFFWVGASAASLFIHLASPVTYALIALLLLLCYPIHYWFVTKMYLQYAMLPIQFRLSQWQGTISDPEKKIVLDFLPTKGQQMGHHLLIFGGRRSKKSQLSVGIGTEYSIYRRCCSYYTGMKLYNLFSLTDDEIIVLQDYKLWTWRGASLLIVDDINPGGPIAENFISPDQFRKLIDVPGNDDLTLRNKTALIKKNVIWVMGNETENGLPDEWKEMLVSLGIPENKIYKINLNFTAPI
jgi:hypothetical protein